MADNFKDLMDEIAPPFLLTQQGRPFMRALGDVKDSLVWRTREAVKARFPEFGSDDELALIGLERQIPRAAGEGRDSYSSRLIGAWDAWTWSAQAYGMVAAFYDSGYTNVRVATFQRRMYSIATRIADPLVGMDVRTLDAGSWKFGTLDDTFWAKFVVIFPTWAGAVFRSNLSSYLLGAYVLASGTYFRATVGGVAGSSALPTLWAPLTAYLINARVINGTRVYIATGFTGSYVGSPKSASSGGPTGTGSGIVDGNIVWNYQGPASAIVDGSVTWAHDPPPASTSDEANAIRALIRRWKPGHMVCDSIIIGTCAETFDYYPAGGTWDDDPAAKMNDTAWISWTP